MERLADAVRPLGQGGKAFVVGPDLMGLVGSSGDDFKAIMVALGYAQTEVKQSELENNNNPDGETEEKPVETDGSPAEALEPSDEIATQDAPVSDGSAKNPDCETGTSTAESQSQSDDVVSAFIWDGRGQTQAKHKKPHKAIRQAKNAPRSKTPAKAKPKGKAHFKPSSKTKVSEHSPFAALAGLKKTLQQK